MITIKKYKSSTSQITIQLSSPDKEEVLEWVWFFEAYGCCHFPPDIEPGERIEELSPGEFSFSFVCQAKRVLGALINSELLKLSDLPEYKGKKHGALPDARQRAKSRFEALETFTPTRDTRKLQNLLD